MVFIIILAKYLSRQEPVSNFPLQARVYELKFWKICILRLGAIQYYYCWLFGSAYFLALTLGLLWWCLRLLNIQKNKQKSSVVRKFLILMMSWQPEPKSDKVKYFRLGIIFFGILLFIEWHWVTLSILEHCIQLWFIVPWRKKINSSSECDFLVNIGLDDVVYSSD